MPVSPPFRDDLAEYIRNLSEWRRARFNDDLRDPRHLRSADALLELSRFIRDLPVNDQRLIRIAHLTTAGGAFTPGQQLAYETGRFHFHETSMTAEGFLQAMVALAERDAGEQGRFGGPQVQGDDPWG
ncbi:MAG: hypothetical protein AB7G88_05195 [Thermomicrobiales bacterium]